MVEGAPRRLAWIFLEKDDILQYVAVGSNICGANYLTRVKELPRDVRLVDLQEDWSLRGYRAVLESESFDQTPIGKEIPRIDVRLETDYDYDKQ